MPSESNLIRLYYAANLCYKSPETPIILSIPGDTTDTLSAISLMKHKLVLRGVSEKRILFESCGHNTREQSLNIAKTYGDSLKNKVIAIVTSPEHMRRSALCFKKTGFKNIQTYPAFEARIDFELLFDDDELGGNKLIPNIGENLQIRYQYWNHLKYIVTLIRKFLRFSIKSLVSLYK